jgi:hypothetical protein
VKAESRAAVRWRGFRLGVSDGAQLDARLTGRCTVVMVAADASAVAVMSAAEKRAVLSEVVPGPRGIVAGQPVVVSPFLMCLFLVRALNE